MAKAHKRFSKNVGAAFGLLKYAGIAPTHQVVAFGRRARTRSDAAKVQQDLRAKAIPEIGEKAAALVKIANQIEIAFKTKKLALLWLNESDWHLDYSTPKEILMSGTLADLRMVHGLLKKIPAP